jgi:anti-anti-sigma factor
MPESTRHRLRMENIDSVTVVHFTDKKIQDKPNIQVIADQLFNLVDALGRCRLLLNFSNVEYLSSGALGKLITLQKKVQGAGGWLVLCNLHPNIHEVFKIAKLDKIFEIHSKEAGDPDAALASLLDRLKKRSTNDNHGRGPT